MANEPLAFIRDCVRRRRVLCTYHVNMRLQDRSISRMLLLDAEASYEIIESYPEERAFPCHLIWASKEGTVFHILFALDQDEGNVRVITAYQPDPNLWTDDMKTRRKP